VATNHKPDGRGQRRTDMAQEGDQTWNTDPRLTHRWPRPRCLHGESVGGWESASHHRDAFRPPVGVRQYRRFEGISDPDDMAIMYAVETASGTAP